LFELRERLGQGGMGVVYRAFDLQAEREVALKVSLEPQPGWERRLVREGAMAAALDHPGIVRIHGAGTAAGRPFLVHELVEGARTFESALPVLGLPERLEVLVAVADATAHAHAKGVVHRDLKPSNILLDADGRPRVADFGLARHASTDLERLTRTGAWVGTPYYSAPEQIAVKAGATPVATADVWALGVMLYEALTDTLPFQGANLLDLGVAIVSGHVPRPSTATSRWPVPASLESVCLRALQQEPAARHPDAGAFAADLRRAMANASPRDSHTSAKIAAVVALLLTGGATATYLHVEERSEAAPVVLPLPPASPASSRLTPEVLYRRAVAAEQPVERYLALLDWLERHDEHARAPEAKRALSQLLEQPLVSRSDPAQDALQVTFSGPRVVLTTPKSLCRPTRWTLAGEPTWSRELGPGRAGVAPLDEGAVWWSSATETRLWLGDDDDLTGELTLPARGVRYLAISPDRRRVAVAPAEAKIVVLDLERRVVERELPLPAPAHALGFSPDGAWLAAACGEVKPPHPASGLHLWDVSNGAPRGTLPLPRDLPLCLAVGADGGAVFVGGIAGNLIRVGPRADDPLVFEPLQTDAWLARTVPGQIAALGADPRGPYVIAASKALEGPEGLGEQNGLFVFHGETGELLAQAPLAGATECLALSQDGTLILRGAGGGTWELWANAAHVLTGP
jgi:serine/threonine protein kinase